MMLQAPRIVIDPSTTVHHPVLGGSALMEGGVYGPGEELRRSPIEMTGECGRVRRGQTKGKMEGGRKGEGER